MPLIADTIFLFRNASACAFPNTSQIYSEINNQLFTERVKTFLLLAGTIASTGVLIIFLIRWNHTLNNEVRRRTRELSESNIHLAGANERLKLHDNMQNEFINVAAHELRTPIQPILSLSQILLNRIKDRAHLELLEVIINNARRLQKLTEDILDVTKNRKPITNTAQRKIRYKQKDIKCYKRCRKGNL